MKLYGFQSLKWGPLRAYFIQWNPSIQKANAEQKLSKIDGDMPLNLE